MPRLRLRLRPRLRLRLHRVRRRREGRQVVTSAGAALCIRVSYAATATAASVAGVLGSTLHCGPRGAGSARRDLLRPGRQPHVAGLEGRRRRGGQGFLRGECGPGGLGMVGPGWEHAWGRASEGRVPRRAKERKPGGLPFVGGAIEPARWRFPDPAQRRPPPLARLLFAFAILAPPPPFPFVGLCTGWNLRYLLLGRPPAHTPV